MKAIVLAAGKGTRLQPITDHRPKHLLEIAGIPILRRILDELLNVQLIEKILLVTHFKEEQIIASVKSWYHNSDLDNIEFIHQDSPEGTGDAVRVALASDNISDNFLVINGDVLFGDSINDMIKWMVQHSYQGLIAGARVPNPTSFGVLHHENYILTGVIEKPDTAPDNSLVNAGLYIFPKEAIPLFSEIKDSSRGEREITDVLAHLVTNGTIFGIYECQAPWFDIGYPWQILEANEYFMKKEQSTYQALGTIEPGVYIHGQVFVAPTARIRSGVYIEGPVYIDEGADIGPNCYIRAATYLGKNTRVGNGCEIKNSVIYKETHAAHLSYLGDSVIGEYCNFGAGTITANLRHDGGNVRVTIKGQRVNSGRRKLGVIMGDKVKTGIGVDILPGVKISSGKWLNAGEVVTRDR